MIMVRQISSLGRPRDPGVDDRVADAAMRLFGDAGWSGFTIDSVARLAGVGKASIYLRWKSREQLFSEAVRLRMTHVDDIDTGTVRGDMIDLARQMLKLYLGARGRAAMRLTLDSGQIPAIRDHHEEFTRGQVHAARALVRRAIARGELAEDTSPTLLLDTLVGGAMLHAMSTPQELRAKVTETIDEYADSLVDFLLNSARASAVTANPDLALGASVSRTRKGARR
ncbi:TetR/AcrR family transcriptional regulator [Rhodococcus erythropolis]|uniref:TetR/AcrR family transcriptional regulator n=1 Tax=Rhodococcus erythropolis TaxID=1833 RepID=UPI003799DF66